MTIQATTHLNFRGDARAALEFYQSILGGELRIMLQSQYNPDPAVADLVMHGQLTTDDGLTLMASDTPSSMDYQPAQGISVSLSGNESDRLHAVWDGLSEGGMAIMPLAPAPWGGEFGMLVDRFGITWMVNVNGE